MITAHSTALGILQREFQQLLLGTLEFDWIWEDVTSHSLITLEFIEKHPNLPWEYKYLSYNPNTTQEYIEQHPTIDWHWRMIPRKVKIDLEFILSRPNVNWSWSFISGNLGISFETILEHPDKAWDWKYISSRSDLTLDFVLSHPDLPWDWLEISRNPVISAEDADRHPDKPWQWDSLLDKPNVSLDFFRKHFDKFNELSKFSKNPEMFVPKSIDWKHVSQSKKITMDIIKQNPHLPWDFWSVSDNPNLTLEFIRNNPEKDWNWVSISEKVQISVDESKNSSIGHLISRASYSINRHLSPLDILDNLDQDWYFCNFGMNNFRKYRERLEESIQRVFNRTSTIKHELIQITQHPNRIRKHLYLFQYNSGIEEYTTT